MIARIINLCVIDEENQNLSVGQKELLKWHFKLGHIGFDWLQWLARRKLLPYKIANVEKPLCASCRFGAGHRIPVGAEKHEVLSSAKGGASTIKAEDLQPGQRISIDQYESRVRGRLWSSRERTQAEAMYSGGTIFVDHASGLIHVEHQVSLNAADTIVSKKNFERMAMYHGVGVQNYHGDNGAACTSREFAKHNEELDQGLTFSAVGVHHQNGVAERAIRTVVTLARTMLLHAALR